MKADAKALQSVLAVMRSQSDECFARPVKDAGWELYCSSPDGTTIMDATLHAAVFPEGTEDTPDEFMIETDRWAKALKGVGPVAEVEFLDGRVRLSGQGLRHTFRLVDVREARNKFRVPDLSKKLTAECMVESERLRALMGAADPSVADDMTVVIRKEGLMASACDETGNGTDLTVPPDGCALIEGQARAMFSTEMWATAMKAIPADAVLDIRLGDDMPAVVAFGTRDCDVTWLCAPRIAQEGP